MNERIRELAEQAGASYYNTYTGPLLSPKDIEKFAELLIRECMLCCERVISDPVPKSVDTWLNGGKQCIDEIKYHFGVKE